MSIRSGRSITVKTLRQYSILALTGNGLFRKSRRHPASCCVEPSCWWSYTLVPSLIIDMMYGLLCLLSLSNESKKMPRPFHLSELPKTGPSKPLVVVNQKAKPSAPILPRPVTRKWTSTSHQSKVLEKNPKPNDHLPKSHRNFLNLKPI